MKEWNNIKLKNIIAKIIDNRGKSAPISDNGIYPIIEINAIGGFYPDYSKIRKYVSTDIYNSWFRAGHPEENDILIPTVGTIGITSMMDKAQACIAQNLIALRLRPDVNPLYVYYFLKSDYTKQHLINLNIGGVQPSIKVPHLLELSIPLPKLKDQNAIANILHSIDQKIELNRQINDNLEQQAQALYKSWFVDFEPFKDGEFIESELGQIPDGWQCIPFSMFVSESKAKTGKIGIKEYSVTNNGICPRDAKYSKSLSQSSTKNKLILHGDLVFGMSRDILNWGVMQEEQGGVSSAYTVYNINSGIVNSTYLELFIKSRIHLFTDLIRPAAREGQGIDKSVLQTKVLLCPPQEVLDTFWPLYNSVTNQIQTTTTEINCLGDVRDTLLPKLMSGELKINEIDC